MKNKEQLKSENKERKRTFEEIVKEPGVTEFQISLETARQLKRIADVLSDIEVSITELTTQIINQ